MLDSARPTSVPAAARDGDTIEMLVAALARLPGYGPRSARRAALQLLLRPAQTLAPLRRALEQAANQITSCTLCGNLDDRQPCRICSDPRRDAGLLCVVADVADLWALERGAAWRGRYHVLGGTLAALDGMGPDQLRLAPLWDRLAEGSVREVVLALGATVEGQTTAHYLSDRLRQQVPRLTITRPAHGLPVGGELDYLDDGTLAAALAARLAVAD